MIVFQNIKYRNFLSVGNKFIQQDFVNGQKKLIIGKNGSGKSVLIDALCFVLYNKAFRKCKKDQLVNSINKKGLEVELEFKIGQKEYKLRRGVKPTFSELYVDGQLKDQDASSYDYQAYIENSILRMTEKTFRQIVVLGSTAFVPFMRLSAKHRRIVIEDLLEVSVFSNMYYVIRNKSGVLQTEFQNLLTEIKLLKNSITHKTDALDSLDNSNSEIIEQNVEELNNLKIQEMELNEKLKSVLEQTENHTGDILSLADSVTKYEDEKFELMDLSSKIHLNKTKNEKERKFFEENEQCHVCHQSIEKDFRDKAIETNDLKIKQLGTGHEQINGIIDVKTKLIKEANDKMQFLKDEIAIASTIVTDIETIADKQSDMSELNESLRTSNTDELDNTRKAIKKLEKQLKKAESSKDDYMKIVNSFTYISNLLRDDGIKSKIIKTYLPLINKLIRKYLDLMDFSIDFRFDEFFNETIKARYKDNFAYGNFSEGQKLRIDLCLLFTWRELSRMKNSAATNLIILDEIADASLDIEGFDAFMKVLNVSKDNQCAIIISHKPEGISHSVDEICTATLVGNYTEMKSTHPETNVT